MQFSGQFSALRHRQFLAFWLGSFSAVGATQLQVMTLSWLVYELSGSALMLGYLGAAAGIPAIVVTLFGGVLADRLNRKHLLTFTSFLTGALLFVLAVLDMAERINAWHVILITGLISAISGLDWPTRQAIFPALIDREDMMSAVALNSIVWQSSRMIFPAFGGLMIAAFDTWLVLILCALGFAVMGLVVSRLAVAPRNAPAGGRTTSQSTLTQIREGLGFIVGHRTFLMLLTLSYASMLFGSSYMQIMPAFLPLLDAGSSGYGYLLSVTGLGSIAGTLVVGTFQHSKRLGWIILGCSFASVLSVYAFSLVTAYAAILDYSMALAMCAGFSIAMCASMFMIASMTVMQLTVPDDLRGRVMGLHGITYSLMPLGGLFAGALATLSSAPVAIALSATIYMVILIGIAATQQAVTSIDGTKSRVAFSESV